MTEELQHRPGRTRRRRRRSRQTCYPRTCSQDSSVISLRQWMKQKANFISDLQPAIFEGTGRGLMARRHIERGEVIVAIPHALLITTQTVLQSDIGERIKGWTPSLTPQQAMAIFLISEKYKLKQSALYPYISITPETFTMPGYFSDTELSLLPKSVYLKVTTERAKLKSAFNLILLHSERTWTEFHKLLTYKNFLWAWYVINTRSVFYKSAPCRHLSHEVEDNIALAPFLDLLNHSPDANTDAAYNPTTDCYEIRTYDHYKKYSEVFISYGAHDNIRLFIEYGFCVPDNPHDVYKFQYDMLEEVILESNVQNRDRKMEILRDNKLLRKLWPQIYTTDTLSENTIAIATRMAKLLIQKAVAENRENKDNFTKIMQGQPSLNPDHVHIARTLLDIQANILSISANSV